MNGPVTTHDVAHAAVAESPRFADAIRKKSRSKDNVALADEDRLCPSTEAAKLLSHDVKLDPVYGYPIARVRCHRRIRDRERVGTT